MKNEMKNSIHILIILILIILLIILFNYYIKEKYTDFSNKLDEINYDKYDMIHRMDDDKGESFIYDIFARNNEIVIVVENRNLNELKVYMSNTLLEKSNSINVRDTIILIFYKINVNSTKKINVSIEYKNNTKEIILYHIFLEEPIKYIASTTQFKFDAYLTPLYTKYYLEQGIDHIYLYYNGKLKESNIDSEMFNNINITIFEWDYPYTKNGKQHSQLAEIHHAYFKYANIFYKYMLFNDLDEYIITEDNSRIIDYIKQNEKYDGIVFHNVWAETLNKQIPCVNNNECALPKQVYRDKNIMKYDYSNGQRTKCIYKSKRINGALDIHTTDTSSFINNTRNFLVNDNNIFYHFMNWSPQLAFSTRQGVVLNDVYIVDFNSI